MAEISAETVKKLRDQTGAGMMDCKKALAESDGDVEKAVAILREKGIAVAQKRESKAATEGMIGSYISGDAKTGVLVEVNCETSFVAKTDEFVNLAKDLAKHVAETAACADLAAMLDTAFRGQTVGACVTEIMGKVGEKMSLSRFSRLDTDGVVGCYIHMGDQIGVLVELKGAKDSEDARGLAKDLAMHISWSKPEYLTRNEVPESALEAERAVHRQWALNEGKPEQVIDRIVEGRMKEFYGRVCLMEQAYIKDQDMTITDLVKSVAGKTGDEIAIAGYVRFQVGETAGE